MAGVRKQPQRSCIGCGETKDKRDLIRVLRTPEREFMIDLTGRKNGRGAYLCRNPECLERAIKRHSLESSFRMAIPQEVYDALREELLQT